MDDHNTTIETREYSAGPREGRLLTELERQGIAVLSLDSHRRLLHACCGEDFRDTLYRLRKKGWLIPIERGKYLLVPRAARGAWQEHPFVIADGLSADEYYISYWSVLSFHQLTEQVPRVVQIALPERKKAQVSFQGWTYQFVHLSRDKFYGFRQEEFPALNGAARIEVRVAEPEKALLDSLDAEALVGGMDECVKALRSGLEESTFSIDRLLDHARRYPSRAVIARLGYALDRLGVSGSESLLPLARRDGYPIYLAQTAPRARGRFDSKWHLWVNLPDDVFQTEGE